MLLYCQWLKNHLVSEDWIVDSIAPFKVFGKGQSQGSLAKWLGYIDKYIIFPLYLLFWVRFRYDRIHICDHSNAMYVSFLNRSQLSITCHDMLAIDSAKGKYRQRCVSRTGQLQQKWISYGLRQIRHIVCVSRKTQKDMMESLGIEADVMEVIYNPLNRSFKKVPPELVSSNLREMGIHGPYFLHVGGDLWYKNRLGVLRIFDELCSRMDGEDLKLVMVGAPWPAEMTSFVEEHKLRDKVLSLVGVDDERLSLLYQGAEALLYPSLEEGFGWPIIEAQAQACPVITSDRDPMREIAGASALLVDPLDTEGAAQKILSHFESLKDQEEGGLRNLERFSVDQIAQQYQSSLLRLL